VRTEREGNMPQRTVYAITDSGREELSTLRHNVLRDTKLRSDPVDLALQYTQDLGEEELRALIEGRRTALAGQLASWQELRAEAGPYLTGLEPLGFDHTLIRLKAELAWHDHVLAELSGLLAQEPPQEGAS
jgi:hypothetical protein